MSETIEYRKEPSGIRVIAHGKFVGWKCNNCITNCTLKNNKYGICHTEENDHGND